MTKYYLNDVEITPEEARKLIPISITEEVVILRELTEEEKELAYEQKIVAEIRKKYSVAFHLIRSWDTEVLSFRSDLPLHNFAAFLPVSGKSLLSYRTSTPVPKSLKNLSVFLAPLCSIIISPPVPVGRGLSL